MKAINITAYTEDPEHLESIKSFMKSLKIRFELTKQDEKPYDPEFVAMIKKGDEEFANGKGIKMSVSEFKDLCK
jgi:hypothetical protein